MMGKAKGKVEEYLFPFNEQRLPFNYSHINAEVLFRLRLAFTIYLTFIYLWSFLMMDTFLDNVIYLTNQGYFLTWLSFLLAIQFTFEQKRNANSPLLSSSSTKCIEIIYEVAICLQLPITIIFWSFLFREMIHAKGVTWQFIFVQSNMHSVPLLFLIIDLVYNVYKFSRQRYLIVLFTGTAYLFVNLLYSLVVRVIYDPIDWVSFFSYVLCFGAYALTFLMHCFGNFLFRRWKLRRINRAEEMLSERTQNTEKGKYKDFHEENI